MADSDTISALISEVAPAGMTEMLRFLVNLQELVRNMQLQVEQGIKSVKGTVRAQKTTDRD
jgi:hypothetical protein